MNYINSDFWSGLEALNRRSGGNSTELLAGYTQLLEPILVLKQDHENVSTDAEYVLYPQAGKHLPESRQARSTEILPKNYLLIKEKAIFNHAVIELNDPWPANQLLACLEHNDCVTFTTRDKAVFERILHVLSPVLRKYRYYGNLNSKNAGKYPSFSSKYYELEVVMGVTIQKVENAFPIFNAKAVDGLYVNVEVAINYSTNEGRITKVPWGVCFVFSNYVDNIFYIDGVELLSRYYAKELTNLNQYFTDFFAFLVSLKMLKEEGKVTADQPIISLKTTPKKINAELRSINENKSDAYSWLHNTVTLSTEALRSIQSDRSAKVVTEVHQTASENYILSDENWQSTKVHLKRPVEHQVTAVDEVVAPFYPPPQEVPIPEHNYTKFVKTAKKPSKKKIDPPKPKVWAKLSHPTKSTLDEEVVKYYSSENEKIATQNLDKLLNKAKAKLEKEILGANAQPEYGKAGYLKVLFEGIDTTKTPEPENSDDEF